MTLTQARTKNPAGKSKVAAKEETPRTLEDVHADLVRALLVTDERRALLRRWAAVQEQNYVLPAFPGTIYRLLGERDEADYDRAGQEAIAIIDRMASSGSERG